MSIPRRHLPLLIVFVAICAALGLGFGERWISRHGANARPDTTKQAAGTPEQVRELPRLSDQALLYPVPRALAPFILQGANGNAVSNADLQGAWTVAFFGFTNCPDVCPTALATMKAIEKLSIERLGNEAPDARGAPVVSLNYWFVSVDPERDTPEVLREYAAYFSPSIVAATAPAKDIERFARDVGVVFFKVPQEAGDYTIDHSMQMLLFDPWGRLHAMWRPPHVAPMMLDDITRIAAAASGA